MNLLKTPHLNEDQVILAVLDEADLPESLKEHLLTCPECRDKKSAMENDLKQLGQMAKRLSPAPQEQIILPNRSRRVNSRPYGKWQMALGTAAAFILIGMIGIHTFNRNLQRNGALISSEIMSEEELMTEISQLSENALPREYMNMLGESDEESEDTFMDRLLPDMDDETLSLTLNGGKPC